MTDRRLATILRKTQTSGPTKRIKQLPVCVSEMAFYEDPSWLETGFNLLRDLAGYEIHYLLPRPRGDFSGFEKKMAGYGDAMVATGALLARLQIPGMVQLGLLDRTLREEHSSYSAIYPGRPGCG